MVIEYTLLLKDKKLSGETLVKKIESLGYLCYRIKQLSKGICVNLNEEIGFSVFLFDSGNYPYNSWKTIFSERNFMLERILEFRMVREYSEFEKRYNIMLKILFDLATELNKRLYL